ncbi:MAG TPA: NAD(P)H-hydrate dehydratase [Candidatus Lustribacter sp.]|nr:NAD(P)H-hydrate dehydratase [Candidatus Lustribacter sp.]
MTRWAPRSTRRARAISARAPAARARLVDRGAQRVMALVGGGDNGGDALYAVAHLAAQGFPVAVVTVASQAHEGGLAAVAQLGTEVVALSSDPLRAHELAAEADLVVDGILGIGGRPGLGGDVETLLGAISPDAYVLAVDLPSGHDPDGAETGPGGVFADETVSFGALKGVHLLPPGERAVGRLTLVDIGLDLATSPASPSVQRLTRADVADRWPVPGPDDDKYSRGVVGIVAGGPSYTGAAVLAVTSAVCSGAGMVRYVGPRLPTDLVRAAVPEALAGPGSVQAWVVGPGLDAADDSEQGRAQVSAAREALASDLPCVVDAGGLDLIAGPRSAPTLLTPHAGECARLLTRLTREAVRRADVVDRPVAQARVLASLTGATVLLKGSTTVVVEADPGRSVWSQADAPPWLATAGAGDVLAGLLGTLLAAGLDPPDAGALGALVHGVAAERANPGGPVRALDVARAIPATVTSLLQYATGPFGGADLAD